MNMNWKKTPAVRRPAGFTLVEVMLAVGIASSAALLIVGLLPQGLDTMLKSASATAQQRALQTIQSDYQMRDWTTVLDQQEACTGELFRFDAQGFPLPQDHADAVFLTRVMVEDGPVLPGTAQKNPRLRTLVVQISTKLDEDKAFSDPGLNKEQRARLAQADKQP